MNRDSTLVLGAAGMTVNPFRQASPNKKSTIKEIQTIINLINGREVVRVDGLYGPNTRKAYDELQPASKWIVGLLGKARDFDPDLILVSDKRNGGSKPGYVQEIGLTDGLVSPFGDSEKEKRRFVNTVVAPIAKEAAKYGLLEEGVAAQIIFETGWGTTLHRIPNNLTGMKANVLKSYPGEFGVAKVGTTEYYKIDPESITDEFATFKSIGDWMRAYAWYLLEGPSSYRYKAGFVAPFDKKHPSHGKSAKTDLAKAKNVQEFAESIHYGGYNTSPVTVDTKRGFAGVGYRSRLGKV